MRFVLDRRARRLLRRVPRTTVYSALELALLSLLALQCARLVWTVATPVDPVGEWRADLTAAPGLATSTAVLGEFDPFFRLAAESGPVVVTSLNLKLYGIRQDRASGRGSAIISTPDGQQRSFAVGEEIVPGVTLVRVDFDSVTIARGGAQEQLFLDQSPPAETVSGAEPAVMPTAPRSIVTPVAPPPSLAAPIPSASALTREVQFQPRLNGGVVTGVTVQPQGSGNAFRAAGLRPGDVIVSVNGRRIGSLDQARGLADELSGGRGVVQVERDGRVMRVTLGAGQ